MKLLFLTALAGFVANAAYAVDLSCENETNDGSRYHLIVNRHTHESDQHLSYQIGDRKLKTPINRQAFLRASAVECCKSAQAQLNGVDGWLIDSWRCERVK